MSKQRGIAIIAGFLSTALLIVGVTSCWPGGDIVYHPPCEPKDGGTDGAGGSGGDCP
jgi:hypothetical protein